MNLTALPTQLSDNTTTSHDTDTLLAHNLNDNTDAPTSASDEQIAVVSSDQSDTQNNNLLKINPNTIVLAEALTDTTISWRIHNCKISKKTVTQDLPLPFLYHYDSLDDAIKQTHPLTPTLLAQFNTPMTAAEAATLLDISNDLLSSPWHVKVIGSLVVFSEALQLAVRLHWTNTGKETQQIYTKDAEDAMTAAFKDWQFFGRVDVLYKNDKQTLMSIDEQGNTEEPLLTIEASADYQQLLASHALTVIAKLEADKVELPWFDTAILERLE